MAGAILSFLYKAMNETDCLTTEIISSLEDRLGYAFKDPDLLRRAIWHSSVSGKLVKDYEQLEFLGDRVLALAIATMLYRTFPDAKEGEMSRCLNALVNRSTCADVARSIGIGRFIFMADSEVQAGGRDKNNILGDVIEAVIGCIYIDAGLSRAEAFVERHWGHRMLAVRGMAHDAKTVLQEWAQAQKLAPPIYTETSRTGADHSPKFTITVSVKGFDSLDAEGSSKREGEQNAARAMLIREKVWSETSTASSKVSIGSGSCKDLKT